MANIDQQVAYFQHLAETSVHIKHTADKPGFFKYDFDEFLAEDRKRECVLFLHQFQGKFIDTKSDNILDEARIQWSIYSQIDKDKRNEADRIAKKSKLIADKILARMKWHRDEDPDHTYCELLRYFDLDNVEYRLDEIWVDGWTGYRMITPLVAPANLVMNADDWATS